VTAARVIEAVGRMIDDCGPDAVLVQGDTLSAYAGGLAAALRRVPLAHVEAGLRSGSLSDPFPEELSRRQLSHLATWNFAPTQRAALNLADEGIPGERIYQVGNTVIDALRLVRRSARARPEPRASARAVYRRPAHWLCQARGSQGPRSPSDGKMILVTAHRRESWGEPLRRICAAIAQLATHNPRWRFVFSVHPNPTLHALIERELGDCEAVHLLQSPPYDEWAEHLLGCDLILTDSGGMQEEGCALGKPVLVLRERTERPEAVEAGSSLVVGTRTEMIVRETQRIMHDARAYARMATPRNVFGDGFAAGRIVDSLAKLMVQGPRS
jgi:UDP-N-acetylglucosamine 2-epimerase (hydrolysing)